MARFSSVGEFSPTGTVLPVGPSTSNSLKTEAAKDARIMAIIAALAFSFRLISLSNHLPGL